MEKFNNKKAFKIQKGSNEQKTIIIFPKKGMLEYENISISETKIIAKALQAAFDQGYEKALRDKNLYKNK